MRVSDVMSTPIETTTPDQPAADARHRMRLAGINHLLVMEGRNAVGVVSMQDLGISRPSPELATQTVRDVMSTPVVTATPKMTIREVANLLRGCNIGCLPVLDRGKPVGMITVTDLLELIGRGVERPIARSTRWTLRHRGPRRRAVTAAHR
jgi:tRNA nucleotidyltransferase (CCA-adding enzyme)